MITELDIYNFQSHKESHLQFHPGVNVIVGPSDSGKTSIIRSIRWVWTNRPSGDAIRSWWKGVTSVELVTPEGIVVRTKDKSDSYTLGISGQVDSEFKAFGFSVPPEILQLLNVSDVNIQMQLDMPFLLSSSPGERAQYFNKIANLDKIDIGLANVNSWIKNITLSIRVGTITIKKATEELEKFEHLEKYEYEVEALEKRESDFRTLCNSKERLSKIVDSINNCDSKIEKVSAILEAKDEVDAVFEVIYKHQEKIRDIHSLFMTVEAINKVDSQIEGNNDLLEIEDEVDILIPIYENRREMVKYMKEFESFIKKVSTLNKQIESEASALEEEESYFKANFPEVCPLCGQKVNLNK